MQRWSCLQHCIVDLLNCRGHNFQIIPEEIRKELERIAVLLDCGEGDILVGPQVLRRMLHSQPILPHCCEHDLLVGPQTLREEPQKARRGSATERQLLQSLLAAKCCPQALHGQAGLTARTARAALPKGKDGRRQRSAQKGLKPK